MGDTSFDEKYRQDWMSDDQFECAKMLRDLFGGWHHLHNPIRPYGDGVEYNTSPSWFSTFDFNLLTRYVFLAHDRCIRASLGSSGPRLIKLILHRRHKREGRLMEYHPTLEEAAQTYRSREPAPSQGLKIEINKAHVAE